MLVVRAFSNVVFGFVLSAYALCQAAPRAYRFDQWTTERGLPQNTVLSIVQSRDGYLWIGTRFGLSRFDGVRFTTFNAANTPGMPCQNCYAMAEDSEGGLWIGTNEGIIRRKNSHFELFTEKHGLNSKSIRRIFQGPSGALWVGTEHGLAKFTGNGFTNLVRDLGIINNRTEVFEDRSGCIWYNTEDGLFRWSFQTRKPQLVVPLYRPGGSRARFFLQDSQNRIWFGGVEGLFCWSSNRAERFIPDHGAPPATEWTNSVPVGFLTGKDDLWVTVSEKSVLHRFVDGKFVLFKGPNDEPIEYVTGGLQDREGTIWVGTRFSGLIAIQPVIGKVLCARDGLADDNVLSVSQGSDSSMWVGTSAGTVSRIRGEAIKSYTIPDAAGWDALSVLEDTIGTVWVGTRKGDKRRSLWRLRDGSFECVNQQVGIVSECIGAIYQDRSGTLWFGTSDGLFGLKGNQTMRFTTNNGLADNSVRGILEDRSGALWIGTCGGGVNVLRDGKFTNYTIKDGLANNTAWLLYEDTEGTMWIGTETGLTRYRDCKFFSLTRDHGLYDNTINWILEDDLGNMWISCNRGISRVSRKELNDVADGRAPGVKHISYGVADGMLSSETNGENQPAGCKSPDGRLWFPTIEGVVSIDPHRAQDNSVPPAVVIEQVTVDRDVMIGNGLMLPQKTRRSGSKDFTLPPWHGRVMQIQYTANSFVAPDKVHFKYRLEGHDADWRDAGADRVAYYTNLKPGDYKFRVIAANNHDRWNMEGASFSFSLAPHYTQTESFWVVIGLTVAGLGLAFHFTRLNFVRRLQSAEQFRAVELERKRIAKDMHDDLGSSLTQISLLTELAARDARQAEEFRTHLHKIGETTRGVFYSLDEIIWATNPKNDGLESLVAFIAKYAEDFLHLAGIPCRLNFPATLPPQIVSATLRHNLFLAVKEALNNIVKHSHATEVWLDAHWTAPHLELIIRDNGGGLPAGNGHPAAEADGLLNMRQRLQASGGDISIGKAPSGGTLVRMIVPVSKAQAAPP
ncbi:MAG TPA: two-component regulator propeller domain-containing protein [Verrucomicrobiae bacterium]|nr:two-component regulator propeller domain-containing protein [Verrucomicrobiae bacterium]